MSQQHPSSLSGESEKDPSELFMTPNQYKSYANKILDSTRHQTSSRKLNTLLSKYSNRRTNIKNCSVYTFPNLSR